MNEWLVIFPQIEDRWFQVTDFGRASTIYLRLSTTYPTDYYHIKARTICPAGMRRWEINCVPALDRFFTYLKHNTGQRLRVRVKVQRRKVVLKKKEA